jgi:hypothetical protein
MKLAILASVARDYADTPAGERAKTEFIAQKRAVTPQRIRLTHDFLVEHPELWAPARRAESSSRRLGAQRRDRGVGRRAARRSVIEISLEDRDPAVRALRRQLSPLRRAARAISYAGLRATREIPSADPARDAFLASARLGVVDASDVRPSARSEAVYESTHEKHGFVNARASVLPVDLCWRRPRLARPGRVPAHPAARGSRRRAALRLTPILDC